MTCYVIEHPQRGIYVGHHISERTFNKDGSGKMMPRYSWRRAHKNTKTYPTAAAAQSFIDENLPKKCKPVPREEK